MNSNPEHHEETLDERIQYLRRSLARAEDRLDNEIDKWNQHRRGPRKGIESAESDVESAKAALDRALEEQTRLLAAQTTAEAAGISDGVRKDLATAADEPLATSTGQLYLFPELHRPKKP